MKRTRNPINNQRNSNLKHQNTNSHTSEWQNLCVTRRKVSQTAGGSKVLTTTSENNIQNLVKVKAEHTLWPSNFLFAIKISHIHRERTKTFVAALLVIGKKLATT